jgi:hypothetical protein
LQQGADRRAQSSPNQSERNEEGCACPNMQW